ncbi:MAG: glutathione transferase GstA [Comamonadaceae bacterium]|nr:MAG: glutathione transferase GstA [Comamonadaceae bacterium]
MKLYYSPGACSLASHITLHEAGLAHEAIVASTKTHQLADGTDYYTINPLGYVPMLEMDDGTRMTEGPAILQYLADQVPNKNLAPANGTLQRYRLQSWLTFIGMELHKGFGPLFSPATPDEVKSASKDRLEKRLAWLDGQLEGKDFLMGEHYSVADAYFFTVTNWGKPLGVDLSPYKNIEAVRARIGARPAVQAAMAAEGLNK